MLLGRERECGLLDRLLGEATDGRSSALLLRGEAGMGKSALLGYATERARGMGMTVLTARGREAEAELAFAGLADLLRPVLGGLEAIPAPQAAALAGALALGPPVPASRFTTGAATLSLLGVAAEERPLLAAVDDAHLLDASSRDALLFAARRLKAEGVVLLLTARSGDGAVVDAADIPEVTLGGLGPEAARALLAWSAGMAVPEELAQRLFIDTAGNPLALLEIAGLLSEGQLNGREPLDEPLPVGPALERAFQRRLDPLPEATKRALLVAAACDSEALETITAATRHLGLDAAVFEPAEAAGIVTVGSGRLHFRHPLVRTAIYHGAPAPERRAVHRALAEALAAGSSTDRRAWHLAAAAVAPDEAVAAALEQAALEARARSGYGAAASALERAARLTPGPEERARRLLQAADTANVGGQPEHALALLDEALTCAADPLVRADIQHLRAQIQMWHEAPLPARELLLAEAARVEEAAPDKAALMLADAALPYTMAGRLELGLETARRAAAVAERAGAVAQTVATGVLGIAQVLVGEARSGYPLALRCEALLRQGNPLVVYQLVRTFGPVAMWVEDYARARQVLTGVIAAARAVSAPGLMPYALGVLAELDFRTGRWAEAYAVAGEAVRLASDIGSTNELAYCLVWLARVEATQSREADCRAHAARALELAETLGTDAIKTYATAALGLLELGLGRGEEAVGYLEQTARYVAQHGLREPGVVQWAPDLVEAYIHTGRRADAEAALAEFEAQAQHTGRTWALAASARCRGLLASEEAFEHHFEEALRWHARTDTPFERARTELCLGQRLRRARRRAPARARLRSALAVFERLGAAPWVDLARGELRATGETAQRLEPWTFGELTAQEVQVALAVAEGKTNREVAAALFLSPKTVEFHLGQIYEKLGLRSRTELVGLMARHGAIREQVSA